VDRTRSRSITFDSKAHPLCIPKFTLITHIPVILTLQSRRNSRDFPVKSASHCPCDIAAQPLLRHTLKPPHWFASANTFRKGEPMLTTLATLGSASLLAQMPGGLLSLAILFFIIAIVAYVLGARGVAGMSAGIGRTLLFVFVVLAIIFAIVSFTRGTV
jgi:uncharacterized membrane protein YtjA (UPF0391 family)